MSPPKPPAHAPPPGPADHGAEERTPTTDHFITLDRLKFLHAVVEQSIDGVAVADVKGRVIYCNRAFAEAHGYAPDEVQGRHLSIFHSAEQMERINQVNAELVQRGSFEGEVWHAHRDGRVFPTVMRNTVLRDDAGQVIGIIGTLRETSQQRQLARQMEIQRDLGVALGAAQTLAEILELSLGAALRISRTQRGGIYLFDEEVGTFTLAHHQGLPQRFTEAVQHVPVDHPMARRVLAGEALYTRVSVLQQSWPVGFPESDRRRVVIQPVTFGAQVVGTLSVIGAADQQLSEAAQTALAAVAGQVGGSIARARAEDRARRSARRFQDLFNNTLSAIGLLEMVLDEDGAPVDQRVLDGNPEMERLLGVAAEQMRGRLLSALMPESSVAVVSAICLRLQRGEGPLVFDRYSELWQRYLKVAAFLLDERQFVLVFTDITELKQSEEELRRHREHLAELVEARTAALSRANDELRQKNAELEQFAYVASHDLQQPLRAVAGHLGLLRQRCDEHGDPEVHRLMGFAEEGAARMRRMIEDLLSLSRLNTHALPPEEVPLDKALDEALANLRPAAAEGRLSLRREPLPVVRAERSQLVQLLQNLLHNALKFRGEAPARVRIWATAEDEAFWRVSLADRGIGFDDRFAERIFRIFQRLHTAEEYPGNGIGLAICKKVVERHGGSIWVEARPGRGATFHFTLPRV